MNEAARYALVNRGLAAHAAGEPFEAHEHFEDAWRQAEGPAREALQALVQICAAAVKGAQGNLRGTVKLLTKAQDRLRPIAAEGALGLDLVPLLARVEGARAAGERGALETVPLPARAAARGVVYLHGFASSPASAKATRIVPRLRADGHEVRVPDLNAGDFEGLTVSRALAQVRRQLFDHTLVIGSSLGGYLGTLLQTQDPRIEALVLMAPAFEFTACLERRHGPAALAAWREAGVMRVEHSATGRDERIGFALVEDAQRHPARPRPTVPTYILQGSRDEVVTAARVADHARAAGAHVQLDLVDDDHRLEVSWARALAAARRLWPHD